jgi:3-dehydroquinate synthase class II
LPTNKDYLFVELLGWKIILAENLLAKFPNTKIIVKTNNKEDMKVLSTVLERGVDGFLINE